MLQSNYCQHREQLIAQSLPGLLAELRLIDVEHLISYVTLRMFNHVADLVRSASEQYFAPGFITLGQGGDVEMDWHCTPCVTIDLIMHLGWANAYFSVALQHDCADVRLNYFSVKNGVSDADVNTQRLEQTIQLNRV